LSGGGGLEDLDKKFPAAAQGRKTRIMHGKLRGKKYHAWTVRQKKKFLQIIDIFNGLVGWYKSLPVV